MRPSIALATMFLSLPLWAAMPNAADQMQNETTPAKPPAVSELKIIDRKVGSGAETEPGKSVEVHYTGWLYDATAPDMKGKKFDSSLDRKETFRFPYGYGRVIKGWEQGLKGMKVGGQRTLIIPAELAYGPRGAGGVIPPNWPLVFDVELIGVK
jgi:FKBP-type peptidyl-prolyl cis-trans isomerase FkpA